MSIEAVSWALSVPVGGNAKVVLLGLANHAHPDGTEAYPSLDTLAVYANCDRSTARRNARKLVDEGWIEEDGEGPAGQHKYRLSMGGELFEGGKMPPVASASEGGGTGATGGVAPTPPEPSLNRPTNRPSEEARAREPSQKPVVYRSKRITKDIVLVATGLLTEFAAQTHRQIAARTSDGAASPGLKQIIGAMLTRPEVTQSQWIAAIQKTVSSPPSWVDGRPLQLGDVFGERAAEWALAPAGHSATVGHATRGAERDFSRFDRSTE